MKNKHEVGVVEQMIIKGELTEEQVEEICGEKSEAEAYNEGLFCPYCPIFKSGLLPCFLSPANKARGQEELGETEDDFFGGMFEDMFSSIFGDSETGPVFGGLGQSNSMESSILDILFGKTNSLVFSLTKQVNLRNGSKEDRSTVEIFFSVLTRIFREEPLLFYYQVMICRDIGYAQKIRKSKLKELKKKGFFLEDGNVKTWIKNIILSSVEGDGFMKMKFTNPIVFPLKQDQ